MRILVNGAMLVIAGVLMSCLPASAQDGWGLLTPVQARAYHACLYAAWVEDYCHENSRAIGACIIANGGGKFPLDDRRFTDDYCWHAAQRIPPR